MNKKVDIKSLPPKWYAVSIVFIKEGSSRHTIFTIVARTADEAFLSCLALPECTRPVFDGFKVFTKACVDSRLEVSAEHLQEFYEAVGEDKP